MAASLIPTEGGSSIALDKPIVLIGRHQECDISLQSSSKVSRRHCCIVQVGDRYVLRDLGSMNGIRVNGHRMVETELSPGDEVAIADVCFRFLRDDPPARPESAARGVTLRAPGHDVSSQIPVAIPETERPIDTLPKEFHSEADGSSGDLKLKGDSNSAPDFVSA
ncbi:MAG: FHA domain-containing protein [Planctomycetales bacterium]